MLIADIGEIVGNYERLGKLDQLIDAAKSGKIICSVNGVNGGPEMAEYVQHSVIEFLRAERSIIVRELLRRGFEE